MRWPMLSIRSTIALGIALAVLAPTGMLWHLEQELTRKAQAPLIEQNRQAVLLMSAAALVQPLWTLDSQQTEQRARRTLRETGVLSLRLSERRPLATPLVLARPGEAAFKGVPLSAPIRHEGELLGELELWFDLARSTACWPSG